MALNKAKELLKQSQAISLIQDMKKNLLGEKGVVKFYEGTAGYDVVVALIWAGPLSNPVMPVPNSPDLVYVFVGAYNGKLWVNGKEAEAKPDKLKVALMDALMEPGYGPFQPPKQSSHRNNRQKFIYQYKFLLATLPLFPFLCLTCYILNILNYEEINACIDCSSELSFLSILWFNLLIAMYFAVLGEIWFVGTPKTLKTATRLMGGAFFGIVAFILFIAGLAVVIRAFSVIFFANALFNL